MTKYAISHLRRAAVLMVMSTIALAVPGTSSAASGQHPIARELATFAAAGCSGGCGSGSTVGPDDALYVTDGPGGRVLRVDPRTGAVTTFASGLPRTIPDVGIGGAMDVAFLGRTVYVLVTLVGPAFGQADVVNGLYRIDRDGAATAIADVGAWSVAHPPQTDFFIASGVQYALQTVHGGLLVSDGHHNRVLRVSPDGDIRQLRAIGNEVPTGLDTDGKRISEHRERVRLVAKPGDAPGTGPRRIAISARTEAPWAGDSERRLGRIRVGGVDGVGWEGTAVSVESSDMVTIPREELNALRAEVRRLRRELGRDVAKRRIQADAGPGDEAPTFSRADLSPAWGIGE